MMKTMMRMKNRLFIIVIIGSLLMGCGQTISVDKTNKVASLEVEILDSVVQEEIEEPLDIYPTEWSQAYIDFLNNSWGERDIYEECVLSLIYLDDNDIPELFISGSCEASGEIIITYTDSGVKTQQLDRIGSKYIPRSGIIYTHTGNMDYYPLTITKLEDGHFSVLATGLQYVSDEEWQKRWNSEGDYDETIYTYEWECQVVSEDVFNSKITEIVNIDDLEYPPAYSYSEMTSILQTGHHSSYKHRYELITDDVNWNNAFNSAIEKGGYLATITSNEEASVIADLIGQEDLGNYSFYVAYRT